MMSLTIFLTHFFISANSILNRNALYPYISMDACADVCNDALGICNERPKFLAMLVARGM